MERIAVFIEQSGIDHNVSIINLLDFLADNFIVDLFLRDVSLTKSRVLTKETIQLMEINKKLTVVEVFNKNKQLLKKLIKLDFQRILFQRFPKKKNWSSRNVKVGFPANQYKNMIVFDPHGLLLCKEIYPQAKPIYYSLELYLKNDTPNSLYSRAVRRQFKRIMARERKVIKDIKGLIIQSREREILFRINHKLNEVVPTLILPVTYQGPSVAEKSDYLRELYQISPGVKIALHLGGMNYWFPCIEMAQAFAGLKQWILVFQGNHNRDYLNLFRKSISADKIENAIVLDQFYDEINALNRVLMSCDIGIAWYNNISANFFTAGLSSGKISAYLRFGLPVIVNRSSSTEEAVEKNGSGICVNEMNDIGAAINKISNNYAYFSTNARQEYEKHYRFENYQQSLLKFILN